MAVSGCGNYLGKKILILVVLADPVGSAYGALINEGLIEAGHGWWEGREDFVPDIAEISLLNEAITVDDKESFLAARGIASRKASWAVHRQVCWWRRLRWCEPNQPKPA